MTPLSWRVLKFYPRFPQTQISFGREFSEAVEAKQVAQQEAERARYLVEKVSCLCSSHRVYYLQEVYFHSLQNVVRFCRFAVLMVNACVTWFSHLRVRTHRQYDRFLTIWYLKDLDGMRNPIIMTAGSANLSWTDLFTNRTMVNGYRLTKYILFSYLETIGEPTVLAFLMIGWHYHIHLLRS